MWFHGSWFAGTRFLRPGAAVAASNSCWCLVSCVGLRNAMIAKVPLCGVHGLFCCMCRTAYARVLLSNQGTTPGRLLLLVAGSTLQIEDENTAA